MVLPYRQGTTEKLQRILKTYKIKAFYETTNTLKNALVRIKDKTPLISTQNFVYRLCCVDCDMFYIGDFP